MFWAWTPVVTWLLAVGSWAFNIYQYGFNRVNTITGSLCLFCWLVAVFNAIVYTSNRRYEKKYRRR